MAHVPTVRALADPTKHARLWYTLGPILPKPPLRESHNKNIVTNMLATSKRWAQPRIVGALNVYHCYHQFLAPALPRLAGKHIIFTTGNSVDRTNPASGFLPRRLGLDYAADRSRLSTEIVNLVRYLRDRCDWDMFDDVHFVYVNHVICPFHITRDFKAVHSLEDVVAQTNNEMKSNGLDARFGDTTKVIGEERGLAGYFKEGISLFRDTLVDSSRAKEVYAPQLERWVDLFKKDPYDKRMKGSQKKFLLRLFKTEEGIRNTTKRDIDNAFDRDCYSNRWLLANAISSVAKAANIGEFVIYATRGSSAHNIMSIAGRLSGLKVDDFGEKKGIMRNADNSVLGECDPRALDILGGRLESLWKDHLARQGKKMIKREGINLRDYLTRTATSLPAGRERAECCPEFRREFARCSRKAECDCAKEQTGKRIGKCVVDFVRNRFTKSDVRGVIAARDGTSKVDAQLLEKTYDELQFKMLKVKGYDKPVSEIELLMDDCHTQGYTVGFVELDREILNAPVDEFINKISSRGIHKTGSWVRFKQERTVQPLKLPSQQPREYHLRASGLTNICHISRIIGKIDQKKLPEEILPNKYSVIGTARHRMANQRPWVDYLRETNPQQPKVWDYCEKEIFCEIENTEREKGEPDKIVLSGHGDAIFALTNGKPEEDIVLVTDYKRGKRGAYEKPAYILRGIIYARGAENALGTEFRNGVVVHLAKRFFHGEVGDKTFPKYYLGFASPDDYDSITLDEFDFKEQKIVQRSGLAQLVIGTYKTEKLLVEDLNALLYYRSLAAGFGFCYDKEMPKDFRRCFNWDECKLVVKLAAKGMNITNYLRDGCVLSRI